MERLALACQRLRYVVVAGWVAVVAALTMVSGAVGGDVSDDYDLPGSQSHRAGELLREAGFDVRSGTQGQLVFRLDPDDDPARVRSTIDAVAGRVAAAIPEARVVSPFTEEGSRQVAPDGSVAYIAVGLPSMAAEDLADVQERLTRLRESDDGPAFEVGGLTVDQDGESGPPSELVGILAAVVVLLLAFGSVIAMSLPILVGIVGAASGVAVVGIMARWVDMPGFAAPVAAMIAIGVGIDYALLVVTRFREALTAGEAPAGAVVTALGTAGRSVLFAGLTVVIASLGLVLMDLKLITGVAVGIAGSVLVTMLAAVTLLPALLAVVGRRIDRFSVHRGRAGEPSDAGPARRWSRQVQRHPWPWAAAATTLLVVLSLPVLDMRLGFSDAGTRPETDTARQAYDLVAEGFGPGANGPVVVVAKSTGGDTEQALTGLSEQLRETAGVAQASPPVMSAQGDLGFVQVVPTTGPRDAATTELVQRLRDDVVPAAADGAGVEAAVGGATAAAVDFADYNADRLPVFLVVVLGCSMLLLLAAFRGLAVAIKAVVVNLLSIGAAFGVTVAVFQWGWGVDLLGLGASAPIEAWAPMMLIAIVFGLSMDYEVFLLSRIKEEYEQGRDNATAVAEGLARTARVITAAAAIMVCVFGSFVLGSSRELQLFGFGLAVAVFLDATVVRMVLVPATMEILGDRNWWLPGWLDRVLPRVAIERSRPPATTPSPVDVGG